MLPANDRVVMISGANRGIGRAIAQVLYDYGFTLNLGVRRPNALARLTSGWDPQRVMSERFDALEPATHSL